MDAPLSLLGVAVVVFASTNIDDIFLLSAFFADASLRPRTIVAGQFLGIGALILLSSVAALAALAIPEGYVALLGLLPLFLGIRLLLALRTSQGGEEREEGNVEGPALGEVGVRARSRVWAVAGVTLANGGDNLGVYVPLFASAPETIALYAVIFLAMTALWCWLGYLLVNNRVIGEHIKRYGHVMLPFVLVALGLWILSGVRVLLH